ncbi:MAG: methyltransferase [Pseudomonadota bacterium]
MRLLFIGASALALAACGQGGDTASGEEDVVALDTEKKAEAVETAENSKPSPGPQEKLAAVLATQSDDAKARYGARHPEETLLFFGVKPGMTVVDTLPGDPWYSGILSEYLGPDGLVVGADYSHDMWTYFQGFADEEFLKAKEVWTTTWVEEMEAKREEGEAPFAAFQYGSLPADMEGKADVVLMVRAAHHFNRLEDEGEFFTSALADTMAVLKPGGVLGIVQHRAPEDAPDEWATGDAGYVKQTQIIAMAEAAGFEMVDSSEMNANPKDQPTEGDFVWRLPPSLGTSRDNEELRAQMIEIGESDRMTLKFRKPA